MSVLVSCECVNAVLDALTADFSRVANELASLEGLRGEYLIDLMAAPPEEIMRINREQRGVDSVTDVLSFPSSAPRRGTLKDDPAAARTSFDPDAGRWFLGDIIICPERAAVQAAEYGHTFEREICYLFAHGICHLFGYDHVTKKKKAAMRLMEERAMSALGLERQCVSANRLDNAEPLHRAKSN